MKWSRLQTKAHVAGHRRRRQGWEGDYRKPESWLWTLDNEKPHKTWERAGKKANQVKELVAKLMT